MFILGLTPVFCLGITLYTMRSATDVEAQADVAAKGALRLSHINGAIVAVVMESRGIYMSNSRDEAAQFVTQMEAHLNRLNEIILDWQREVIPSEKAKIAELGTGLSEFSRHRRQLMLAAKFGDLDRARLLGNNEENRASRKALNESVSALQKLYVAHQKDADAARIKLRQTNLLAIGTMVGIAILLGALGAYTVHRTVILLFRRMRLVMLELASGNLSVEFTGVDRKDEIGDFARAFKSFKEQSLRRVRLEEETATQQAQLEHERAAAAAEQAERQARQTEAVLALTESLHLLSAGDLRARITAPLSIEFKALREDFNGTAEQLQEALQLVQMNAETIGEGAREIASATDDLARRTEQQAANLEQTAAAIEQITATVKKTAEGAEQVSMSMRTAKTTADKATDVVTRAVASVVSIQKVSSEIGNIIGVVDEIAFQTNLLALNAGVEAARAGEAGRGFAVVASEVRALAQRSAQAAKEIKALVATSSTQVADGVKLVNEAGEALVEIVSHVQEVYVVVSEIAAGTKEQAIGVSEVSTAINVMDQATQQNASMVEETNSACHSLASKVVELTDLTNKFNVGPSHHIRAAA